MPNWAYGVGIFVLLLVWEILKSIIGNLLTPVAGKGLTKARGAWITYLSTRSEKAKAKRKANFDRRIQNLEEDFTVFVLRTLSSVALFSVAGIAAAALYVPLIAFPIFMLLKYAFQYEVTAAEIDLRKKQSLLAEAKAKMEAQAEAAKPEPKYGMAGAKARAKKAKAKSSEGMLQQATLGTSGYDPERALEMQREFRLATGGPIAMAVDLLQAFRASTTTAGKINNMIQLRASVKALTPFDRERFMSMLDEDEWQQVANG